MGGNGSMIKRSDGGCLPAPLHCVAMVLARQVVYLRSPPELFYFDLDVGPHEADLWAGCASPHARQRVSSGALHST